MASFKGTYDYTVDSKGRVNIPARFRRALPAGDKKTFVVTRGADGCIDVWPQHEWASREEKLKSLSGNQKDNRLMVRLLLQDASESQFDSQGRISIPPPLLNMAKIGKDVKILGALDHIELWNPDMYDSYLRDNVESYETVIERIALH